MSRSHDHQDMSAISRRSIRADALVIMQSVGERRAEVKASLGN
jgi:hypothetical protein